MLFYVDIANNNASLCTMELNINDESGCKRQNRGFFPTNIPFQALHQTLQTTKIKFEKLLG